jgi:hypothetical protein
VWLIVVGSAKEIRRKWIVWQFNEPSALKQAFAVYVARIRHGKTTSESIDELEIVRDLIEERRSRLGVSILDVMASRAKARKLQLKYRLMQSGFRIADCSGEGESVL